MFAIYHLPFGMIMSSSIQSVSLSATLAALSATSVASAAPRAAVIAQPAPSVSTARPQTLQLPAPQSVRSAIAATALRLEPAQVTSFDAVRAPSDLVIDGSFGWMVSDDAQLLYQVDINKRQVTHKVFLVEANGAPASAFEGLAKEVKPDLEAMTVIDDGGVKRLLCLGSGSKSPTRDMAYLVTTSSPYAVEPLSLKPLYDSLRGRADVVGDGGALNIEGATRVGTDVWLLQRGNVSGHHTMISIPQDQLLAYLRSGGTSAVALRVHSYALPSIDDVPAGFSAATTVQIGGRRLVLFAASVEDTGNAIDDGKTLGSFVGVLSEDAAVPARVTVNNATYRGKIEGIAVRSVHRWSDNLTQVNLIAVTDGDGSPSEWLELSLVVQHPPMRSSL